MPQVYIADAYLELLRGLEGAVRGVVLDDNHLITCFSEDMRN
jgi:hypothetical protein